VTSFQRVQCAIGRWVGSNFGDGDGNNFTVQKSNKNYLSQVIKVNINSDKSNDDYMYP